MDLRTGDKCRLVRWTISKEGFAIQSARPRVQGRLDFSARRVDRLVKISTTRSPRGPVNVGFTGPADLLRLIMDNPGLRKNVLSKLVGLTERTVKRYLTQLSDKIEFLGVPKTGGYYVKNKNTLQDTATGCNAKLASLRERSERMEC